MTNQKKQTHTHTISGELFNGLAAGHRIAIVRNENNVETPWNAVREGREFRGTEILCPTYLEFGVPDGCVGETLHYDCRRSLSEIWKEENDTADEKEEFLKSAREDYLRLRTGDVHCLFLLSW